MLFNKLVNKKTILISFFLCSCSNLFAATSLTITSGRGEPFVTTTHNGFYDLIVKEMFQRIGIDAKVILLPSERSLINANSGVDDGNIARVKGLEKKYTNLLMVPGKVIDFEFVAFSKNKDFKVKNWHDLKLHNVAFINGWKVFEKKVSDYKSLVRTQNSEQLFNLLSNDRVDIALYDRWSGIFWISQHNTNINYLQPPIASFQLYLYLNKKHRYLIEGLSQALIAMKKDGSYQKIYDNTLNKLLN